MLCAARADPYADDMRAFAAQVPVVTYAMYNKDADVWPEKMRFSLWETEVVVQTPVGALQVTHWLLPFSSCMTHLHLHHA